MTIKRYTEIIKNKRKNTSHKEYLEKVLSWIPMNFYKNSGEISRFPETERSPKIISNKKFSEKRDEMHKYSLEYNFNKTFFKNFEILFKNIPLPATIQQMEGENTKYSDMIVESRNCYLSNIVCGESENIYYSFQVVLGSKNIFSSVRVRRSQNVYYSLATDNCSKIFYSKYIKNSNDIWFSSNLIGCNECIFCDNLDNCKYYIQNKQYTKEEYLNKKKELFSQKHNFENFYEKINTPANNINSNNCEGILLIDCDNVQNSSFVNNLKNGNNCIFGGEGENFYDCFDFGVNSGDFYGAVSVGTGSSNIYCSNLIETCYNMYYSYNCNNSNHCFGCIGVINKNYCILNKQYSKENWEILVEKIMESMNNSGELGDFFPSQLNPFYFNQTIGGLLSKISKEKILEKGFLIEENNSKKTKSIKKNNYSEINKNNYLKNGNISENILNKNINDDYGKQYTVIKQEIDFLNKYNLPIPKKHWSDRIKEHLRN